MQNLSTYNSPSSGMVEGIYMLENKEIILLMYDIFLPDSGWCLMSPVPFDGFI